MVEIEDLINALEKDGHEYKIHEDALKALFKNRDIEESLAQVFIQQEKHSRDLYSLERLMINCFVGVAFISMTTITVAAILFS